MLDKRRTRNVEQPTSKRKTFRERVRRYRQTHLETVCQQCRRKVRQHTNAELMKCVKSIFSDDKSERVASELVKRFFVRDAQTGFLTCAGCSLSVSELSAAQHALSCESLKVARETLFKKK